MHRGGRIEKAFGNALTRRVWDGNTPMHPADIYWGRAGKILKKRAILKEKSLKIRKDIFGNSILCKFEAKNKKTLNLLR